MIAPRAALAGLLAVFLLLFPGVAASEGSGQASRRPSGAELQISAYSPDLILRGGGPAGLGKAATDSFYIYGGPGNTDRYGDLGEAPDGWIDGKFQNEALLPAVQPGTPYPSDGWFGDDLTESDPYWQLSTYNSPTGTQAIWSGQSTQQQPGWVAAPGYGNNWNDWIRFRAQVDDKTQPTTVTWSFVLNHDTEPWYDFLRAQVHTASGVIDLLALDSSNQDSSGVFTPVQANLVTTLLPEDYVGPDGDLIQLRFAVQSDGGWSDEDGIFPTDGAAQIDDVTVDLGDNGDVWFDDFEQGFGNWQPVPSTFCGDFAKVFPRVFDIDPCAENTTPVLAFIDDGTPPANDFDMRSTGGSVSAQYGYGVPGGFVNDYTGGLSNGRSSLNNEVWSPAINFDLPGPQDDDAKGVLILAFDRYTHLPLQNGQFYIWSVRSTADTPEPGENPTFDLTGWSGWLDNNFVYYGGGIPIQGRTVVNVSDKVFNFDTVTYVQVSLGVVDLADLFAFAGSEATPSPTFDNVSLQKAAAGGPSLSARATDVFQDGFSISGAAATLYDGPGFGNDESQFAARIDRAAAINGAGTTALAGDSLSVDVVPVVPGTALTGFPVMKYVLFANPAFDHVRDTLDHDRLVGTVSGNPPLPLPWNVWEGECVGDSTRTLGGGVVADRFAIDVPFDGPFDRSNLIDDPAENRGFYPGDWFFYYIEASDTAGNTRTIPGGPGAGAAPHDFPMQNGVLQVGSMQELARSGYDRNWRIRALPTIDISGSTPNILFVNDAFGFGNQPAWSQAWRENALAEGRDFDDFTVMAPSSGVDNGIGSVGVHGATADQLSGYDCLIYDGGLLSSRLLSNGDDTSSTNDRGDDQQVLTEWHAQQADRFAVYFGDHLYSFLQNQGGNDYLQNVLAVELGPGGADVGPLIGDQTAPIVAPTVVASPAFSTQFLAYGGCDRINQFDDIGPLVGSGAVRFHEFLSPGGHTGAYSASASVWHDRTEGGFRKVDLSFPFGFQFVREAGATSGATARGELLSEVLNAFGRPAQIVDAPGARGKVALGQNFPNPFNPTTRVPFFAPSAGHVRLRVLDARGRVVRTLLDEPVSSGEHSVAFDGHDQEGTALASGVYLYELAGFGTVQNRKMILLK